MTASNEFRLASPADAEIAWLWDAHHCPRPLPYLPQAGLLAFARAGMGMDAQFVNGYLYVGMRGVPSSVFVPPSPYTDPRESWERHYLPLVRAQLEDLRALDVERPAPELAAMIPAVMQRAAYGFACTMTVLGQAGAALMPLVQFLERRFPGDGMLRAMTIGGGHANDTAGLGEEIRRLARLAAANPEGVAAVRAGALDAALAATLTTGDDAFLRALDDFLYEHGQSSTTWFDFHSTPWAEDPSPVFRLIAAALDRPGAPAESAAERREAMIAECAGALPPGDRDTFHALVAAAVDYVPIVEGRARWQVAMSGSMRRPILSLGSMLAAQGALDAPDDVFHLRLRELGPAANGDGPSRAEIRARREALAEYAGLVPPQWLGRPVSPEVVRRNLMMRELWGVAGNAGNGDGGSDTEPGAIVVRGLAASRGTVTGRARVALRFEDAEALEPGDVLVCPFTAPAWTPYFAIAAAVVTNTGGALSHSAIHAREYALPCVVGTGNATRAIPDGALITVDGSAGTVTIERLPGSG